MARDSAETDAALPEAGKSEKKRARAGASVWLKRNLSGLLFLLTVVAPTIAATTYLFTTAADQYTSETAFAVRNLENQPQVDLLGLISPTASSSATDSYILYDFIRSQSLVKKVDAELNLREIYNKAPGDWVFSLGRDRTIEELVDYWNLAVTVSYDNSSSIIYVRTYAFTPEDAQRIAEAIVRESEKTVNALSEQARQDAVRFTELELEKAEERLQSVRRELYAFRETTQEVDPSENAKLAIGLVASLEAALAKSRAELSTISAYLGPDAPSIRVLNERIASLETQIEAERSKLSTADPAGDLPPLTVNLNRYEELVLARLFAENFYTGAQTALVQAQAEARRQQRYLATHIKPTLAEEALYPSRALLSAAVFVLLAMTFSIVSLIIGNIRDRA